MINAQHAHIYRIHTLHFIFGEIFFPKFLSIQPLALGTVAHDITTLEDQNNNAGLQLQINAMVEQERLEYDGIGDELMEMQEILWPIKRLQVKDFAIDMLFEYEDDDGSTLVWCQGRVVAFIKESIDKHVYVKIA